MRTHETEGQAQSAPRLLRQTKDDKAAPESNLRVAVLHRSLIGQSSGEVASVLHLQKTYGNHFTRALMARRAQSIETTKIVPEVEETVQCIHADSELQRANDAAGGASPAATPGASSSSPTPTPPAPATAEETIARAIAVFMASSTSGTRLGRQVLGKLIELNGESEIGYARLDPGVRAESREGIASWGRHDIAVSEQFRQDVIMTSLRLVHEAIHQIQDRPYVDEEMTARNLQIDYYSEMERGIPFGSHRYQAATGTDPDLELQRQRRASHQLVDHIINNRTYSESLTVEWVRNHLRDWGGTANRWRHTKGRYLQVLSEEPSGSGRHILDILESETEVGGFNHTMSWTGGGDPGRGLLRIREAFRRGHALWATEYYRRIQALQRRFTVDLGIPEPPAASSH